VKYMRCGLSITVIAIVLLFSFAQTSGTASSVVTTHSILSSDDLTLIIDYGNGTVHTFTNVSGETVYNATISVVEVEGEWQNNLIFVTAVAGVSNNPDDGLWWQFWVNGELSPVAANLYQVDDGDTIAWRRLPPEDSVDTLTVELAGYFILIGIVAIAFLGLLFAVGRRRT